jgi:hypothetical protein
VEEIARGVIDIEEDSVKSAPGRRGVEAGGGSGESEKVTMDQAATRIARERRAERYEAALMPFDHGVEGIDDNQFAHRRMLERGDGGVAEPESAHDDIAWTGVEVGQAEIGERDFDFVEEARHEKVVPELHLEDFEVIQRPQAAAAEREVAENGFPEIEFGKVSAHLLVACLQGGVTRWLIVRGTPHPN